MWNSLRLNEFGVDLGKAWEKALEIATEEAALSDRPFSHRRALQLYFGYTRP